MASADDARIGLTAGLTEQFGVEIGLRDLRSPLPWPTLPDIASMIDHLGGVHRWAAQVLRTRGPVPEGRQRMPPGEDPRRWYERGRLLLLDAMTAVPPDEPCWIIGGRTGTAAFWRRRMVFENVKHLIDVRAAGGGHWQVAAELSPADYADGIDELFTEFLPRSRPRLPALPGALTLEATDTGDRWRIATGWTIGGDPEADDPDSARIRATAGDLALAVWERADPLAEPGRFHIEGAHSTVAAFVSTSVHPW